MTSDPAQAALVLRRDGGNAGPDRLKLLAAIGTHGSIAAAAKLVGLSYKGAWDAVQALNNLFERPLVETSAGGRQGGQALVTPAGEMVLAAYAAIERELAKIVDRLDTELGQPPDQPFPWWSLTMKTSARNAFHGRVTKVSEGPVNAEVVLDIGGGIELVAVVTQGSVQDLGLVPGRRAAALIKSSFVILVPGDQPLRTSARNCLAGTVIRHETGTISDEVVLDLGNEKTLTAVISRESGETLGFAIGDRAQALIKAPHVILAVD